MPTWLPLALELIGEWIKEGEPKKACIERLWAELKKLDLDDLTTLGTIMEVQGAALRGIANVLSENAERKELKTRAAKTAAIN